MPILRSSVDMAGCVCWKRVGVGDGASHCLEAYFTTKCTGRPGVAKNMSSQPKLFSLLNIYIGIGNNVLKKA